MRHEIAGVDNNLCKSAVAMIFVLPAHGTSQNYRI
jgi:hypothetical protein